MKILVVSDSFKGSMSSKEVGIIICKYYQKHNITSTYIPISDGGEGFLDTINYLFHIEKDFLVVEDANFHNTKAAYIIDRENKVAYLELAEAVGIAKLKKEELNALYASSYGFGRLIKEMIIQYKVKKIVIGIGGSATSDMGCGMLEALGVEFIDKDGFLIEKMCNAKLMKIRKIKTKTFEKLIKGIEFVTLTDVTNPLLGAKGSIATFGMQKGATKEQLFLMEQNLIHFLKILKNHHTKSINDFEGSGAAGGIGFAMHYFFNSKIELGIDSILKMIHFDKLINDYDVVITGEGCLDSQSLDGKVISGIKKYNPKRLIIICGQNKLTIPMKDVYSIVPTVTTYDESFKEPIKNLYKLLDNVKI